MKSRKWWVAGCLLVGALLGLAGCGQIGPAWKGSPKILVSFAPLYSFATNVAGEYGSVLCLCKDVGPHNYEYNIRDTVLLKKADLFLANGLSLDDGFCDKLNRNSGNPKLRYVKVADSLDEKLRKPMAEHDHDGHHHHGDNDPHVWLGIPQAVAMVEAIAKELAAVDPPNAADYQRNAAAYIERLQKMHADGKKELAALKGKPIVTFHESLTYFADSFDLTIADAVQIAPGVEVDGQRLAKLAKLCEEKKVSIITIEPQYPEVAANTLRERLKNRGLDVKLVVVDPLETVNAGELSPDWYEKKLRENIENLAK
jgi:ABC-type Zn uptake system ZnuABC Zn-binding protein ZnuA